MSKFAQLDGVATGVERIPVLARGGSLSYGALTMERYGITVEQMSAHGRAAVRAAERLSANTVVYRDQVVVAAIVPADTLAKLEPPDPGASGEDPLLSVCGTCADDNFVDQMESLGKTVLFRRD